METILNNSLQPTSVSVLMINAQGMMLSVLGQDYFVSYNRVPWLRDARISSALNVRMAGPNAKTSKSRASNIPNAIRW